MLFTSDGGVPQSPQQAKPPATPNGGEHFDPSEYRDKGMGMGLSICHSIVQNHGGRIWVSPGPDGGSIFEFELPTQPVNEVEMSKVRPPLAARVSSGKQLCQRQ
jgi:hypothetical protein